MYVVRFELPLALYPKYPVRFQPRPQGFSLKKWVEGKDLETLNKKKLLKTYP